MANYLLHPDSCALYLTEQPIYGSSRLGVYAPNTDVTTNATSNRFTLIRGLRKYELSNWLGNVQVVISDKKIPICNNTQTPAYYEADVLSAKDYYPFGMTMTQRGFDGGSYKYGYNGKENDDELNDWQDYGERMYMRRLGRFPTPDPLTAKFPMLSPYQFGSLNPISNIDLDGLEGVPSISYEIFKATGITTTTARQVENDVKAGIVKAGRLSQDALIVTGGVLTVVASGGTALPIALGVVAAGGGTAKFYFDAKGDYDKSDATPTSISGTVMVTANYMVGQEVFSQSFQSTVSFAEGVATLDLKNVKSPNLLTKTKETVGLMNLAIDATSIPDNLKDMLSPNTNYAPNPTQNKNYQIDNTYVVPLIITPEMKKIEPKKTTKKGS
jgi:RHS repeat-associated protein